MSTVQVKVAPKKYDAVIVGSGAGVEWQPMF